MAAMAANRFGRLCHGWPAKVTAGPPGGCGWEPIPAILRRRPHQFPAIWHLGPAQARLCDL